MCSIAEGIEYHINFDFRQKLKGFVEYFKKYASNFVKFT